ncbi:unnamed protein product [Trifolium pratense]|uniref:Uncharacterized protein n=1 Tax=Trifolium pratense TaxID=57577 RepID=A0ACB0I807_TRIPR|nr:unnamed protein product [Trifolium pratense]
MANETSARVSDGKTQEEQDQLDRSKKKAKIDVSSQDTVVMETQRMDVQKQNNDIISQRPKVSYRDICMNFNGGSNQDTSPEEDWWFMNKDISNEEDEMEEEEKVHEEVTEESLFVPVAKIDLRKILRSKFVLNKRTYTVEYEGINLVCFTCGRYGHRKDQCEITNGETPQGPTNENLEKNFEKQKEQDNNTNEKFGPWMHVQRGGRRRKQQPRQSSTGEKSGKEMVGPSNNHGSRFGALLIDEGVKDNNGDELIGERQMESDKIDQVKHLAKETQATETHSKTRSFSNPAHISQDPNSPEIALLQTVPNHANEAPVLTNNIDMNHHQQTPTAPSVRKLSETHQTRPPDTNNNNPTNHDGPDKQTMEEPFVDAMDADIDGSNLTSDLDRGAGQMA